MVASRYPGGKQTVPVLAVVVVLLSWCPSLSAESYSLLEDRESDVVSRVSVDVRIRGQVKTPVAGQKAQEFPISSNGAYIYRERMLPPSGRDARAFRSARIYETAQARIQVGESITTPRLNSGIQFVVVEGERSGVEFYNPLARFRRDDLDLLSVPGESLAALALLPRAEMELGEKWNVDDWAVQMLVDIDAVLKSELVCELKSVKDETALIAFAGSISGATVGAATELTLQGEMQFNIARKYLQSFKLVQTEKRQVGAISPGLEVTAEVNWTRAPIAQDPDLTQARLAQVALEPAVEQLQLVYDSPWSVRFNHSRNWHVFHQTPQILILRLLDQGRLVSQCNVSPVQAAKPGSHTSESQFQTDIQTSLGERLKSIVAAEQITLEGAEDRFVYRVTVDGESGGKKMRWIYYLCAAPSGQQIAFVFAVDREDIERLGKLHELIVSSLQFTARAGQPTAVQK